MKRTTFTLTDMHTQPEVSTTSPVDVVYEIVRTPTRLTILNVDVQNPPDSVTCTRTDRLSEDR